MDLATIFQISNAIAGAGWIILLSSPWWPTLANRLSGIIIPLLLSVAYTSLVMVFWGQSEGGFDSLENVMKLFIAAPIALAGWLHYLAFDLFLGAWEVRTAREEAIPFWLVIPCLILTFLFGPAGFLLFTIIRFINRQMPSQASA